jgi:hypothetical protein
MSPNPAQSPFSVVFVKRDGREICNMRCPEGKNEYRRRTMKMRERQGGRCCLEMYAPMCPGPLRVAEATFDHESGRGGGKRDDRIVLPDGTWINGAAHAICNVWKGSMYLPYNQDHNRLSWVHTVRYEK